MKNLYSKWLIPLSVIISACNGSMEKEHEQAKTSAQSFAAAFFNLNFDSAASFCVPESYPWIRFKASNITEKDLEVYNSAQQTAEAELKDLTFKNDSTAIAVCKLSHVLLTDSLERKGIMTQEKAYIIPLVKRNGKWFVKMEGPLQSAE